MANEIKKYLDVTALGVLVDQIKNEDAKGLKAAKDYADSLAKNYDVSGAAATAESNAKAYTDELANGQVKLNKEAIEKLNGGADVEGSVAKAIADVKVLIDADIDAVEVKADKNAEDIAAINNVDNGILAQAKSYTDTEVAGVQGNVDELSGYVGTFTHDTAKTVVEYIDAKTDGIATSGNLEALANRVTGVEGKVATIEGDYLKAADKTELEGKITAAQNAADAAQGEVDALEQTHATDKKALEDAIALKADITALNEVSAVANAAVKQADYDVKVKALEDEDARIVGLVEAEAERAAGVESGLEERLVEVEAFFKTAEGESLDQALDTLVELQKYITDEGAVADQMLLDIAANKKAIEDHVALDHDFATADATLKSELEGQIALKADTTVVEGIDGRVEVVEGKVSTLEGKVSTLEGEMDAVEGAVATKAEQSALEEAIEVLEGVDAGLEGRIAVLEAKHGDGEGTVESLIATAKQEAIDAAGVNASNQDAVVLAEAQKYADDEIDKVEAIIATLQGVVDGKVAQSDLTALTTRVETAEGEIDTLQTEMDAVEVLAAANKAAHEANAAAIALKASQADLEAAVARIAVNEGAISTINTTLADKAEQDDLDAAIDRIAANEAAIATNTSAINAFAPITESEVNALFA